jgi:hypothetical protein
VRGLGALVAGVGTLVFALAPGFGWACAGRFLIGGSVAVAFVGLLQVSNNWLPVRLCAMAAGRAVALWTPGLPPYALAAALLAAGFSSGCMIISFAFAKESVPEDQVAI